MDGAQTNTPEPGTFLERYLTAVHSGAPAFPYAGLLGMRLLEVEPGRAKIELEVAEHHQNPVGTVHGGVYCSLADTAMGIAYSAALGPGQRFVTVELHVQFLRPAQSGRLLAEGRLIKSGRRLGFLECDIRNDQGELLARASCTCMALPERAEVS